MYRGVIAINIVLSKASEEPSGQRLNTQAKRSEGKEMFARSFSQWPVSVCIHILPWTWLRRTGSDQHKQTDISAILIQYFRLFIFFLLHKKCIDRNGSCLCRQLYVFYLTFKLLLITWKFSNGVLKQISWEVHFFGMLF